MEIWTFFEETRKKMIFRNIQTKTNHPTVSELSLRGAFFATKQSYPFTQDCFARSSLLRNCHCEERSVRRSSLIPGEAEIASTQRTGFAMTFLQCSFR
jgi:hypothetical protein